MCEHKSVMTGARSHLSNLIKHGIQSEVIRDPRCERM